MAAPVTQSFPFSEYLSSYVDCKALTRPEEQTSKSHEPHNAEEPAGQKEKISVQLAIIRRMLLATEEDLEVVLNHHLYELRLWSLSGQGFMKAVYGSLKFTICIVCGRSAKAIRKVANETNLLQKPSMANIPSLPAPKSNTIKALLDEIDRTSIELEQRIMKLRRYMEREGFFVNQFDEQLKTHAPDDPTRLLTLAAYFNTDERRGFSQSNIPSLTMANIERDLKGLYSGHREEKRHPFCDVRVNGFLFGDTLPHMFFVCLAKKPEAKQDGIVVASTAAKLRGWPMLDHALKKMRAHAIGNDIIDKYDAAFTSIKAIEDDMIALHRDQQLGDVRGSIVAQSTPIVRDMREHYAQAFAFLPSKGFQRKDPCYLCCLCNGYRLPSSIQGHIPPEVVRQFHNFNLKNKQRYTWSCAEVRALSMC